MRLILVSLLTILVLAPLVALADARKQALLFVQVRESRLRSQPEFWANAIAPLSYGDSLTPLGAAPSSKSWLKVKLGDTEGYVHVSAVTSRRVVLKVSANRSAKAVNSSDVVLAGKGFNNQVEQSYAASRGVSFVPVDDVEKISAPSGEEARAFLQNGKLKMD